MNQPVQRLQGIKEKYKLEAWGVFFQIAYICNWSKMRLLKKVQNARKSSTDQIAELCLVLWSLHPAIAALEIIWLWCTHMFNCISTDLHFAGSLKIQLAAGCLEVREAILKQTLSGKSKALEHREISAVPRAMRALSCQRGRSWNPPCIVHILPAPTEQEYLLEAMLKS